MQNEQHPFRGKKNSVNFGPETYSKTSKMRLKEASINDRPKRLRPEEILQQKTGTLSMIVFKTRLFLYLYLV